MLAIGIVIVAAAGVAGVAVARSLNGEASLLGGYFAGFAAGALIALLYLARAELPDETLHTAVTIGLLEPAGLGPFLGVCAAKIWDAKPAQWPTPLKRARAAVASGNLR